MLAKHTTKIEAEVKCPCLACLGAEVDSYGRKCIGCAGEGFFWISRNDTVEGLHDYADGSAWDYVATKLEEAGVEISEDAMKYEVKNAGAWGDLPYEIELAIVPYPISRENAAAMNALVRKCPDERRSALEAGIPASVIDGEKRLGEVLSAETIALMCGLPVRE